MDRPRFVLVGGGQAAAAAADELRARGFAGDIVLLTDEPHHPYERPPLSKEYLLSGVPDELPFKPAAWYEANGVTLRLGVTATGVDPKAHMVALDDGTEQPYDKLLVCTGGRPRTVPGIEGDRVRYLRDRADADRLREDLAGGGTLAILGAGFVGCEVAASARRLGTDVVLLEALDAPMKRALGDEVGHAMADVHRRNGVDVRLSTTVQAVTDTGSGLTISTSGGEVRATVLLVAVGMVPNTEFLAGSGIEVDNGVLVDEFCRSSDPDVFAAGDVANAWVAGLGRRVRVEHYDNASKQGRAAAANMLEAGEAHSDDHWFWSDQYEHNLQAVGLAHDYDEIVIRRQGDGAAAFAAFYVKDSKIQAAFALDLSKEILRSRKLIAAGTAVTREQLADPDVDLRKIGRPERGPRPS